MDFSAKRLALLAGVGDSEDRHEIVREYAQQLNESAETRQLNEDEEAVRKAVRRTIQKMVSEGAITLQEDSIARELEHLRANIQADHDHLAALVDDIHDDKDEIERAEHHREEMREDAHAKDDGDLKPLTPKQEKMLAMMKAAIHKGADLEELPDGTLKIKQSKVAVGGPKPEEAEVSVDEAAEASETINEADASLRRLQMLAGVQILSEGYTDDNLTEGYSDDELRELCHSKDHNCAVVVDHPEWGRGKPLYESHAVPDDEGNVEWYDVQFKHGVEKKVMAEDVTILEMEEHMHNEEEDDDVDESHCSEGEHMEEDEHMEEGEHDEAKLYELEDGRMYMEMGGRRYMMQEMEEEELDEKLTNLPNDAMYDEETGQVVVPHDKQAE